MTERSVPSSRWELMGECWSGGMCDGTPSLAEEEEVLWDVSCIQGSWNDVGKEVVMGEG